MVTHEDVFWQRGKLGDGLIALNNFTSPKLKSPFYSRCCNVCKTMQLTKLQVIQNRFHKISSIYNSAMLAEKTGRQKELSELKKKKPALLSKERTLAFEMFFSDLGSRQTDGNKRHNCQEAKFEPQYFRVIEKRSK